MLDIDLANVYSVKTKEINKPARRNMERFSTDYIFQLTKEEVRNLRCQIGTSSWESRRRSP